MDTSQVDDILRQPGIIANPVLPLDLSMANLHASSSKTESSSNSRTELYVPPKKRLTWRAMQRESTKTSSQPTESASCSTALDLSVKGTTGSKHKTKQTRKRRKPSRTYDFGTGTSKRQKKKKESAASSKDDAELLSSCVPSESTTHTSTESLKAHASEVPCLAMKTICTTCAKIWKQSQRKQKGCRKRQRGATDPSDRRQSQRLVIKNLKLPFSELPRECKLAIFSFLSPQERCVASLVCHDWNELMYLPGLWSHINLNIFDAAVMSKAGGSPKMGMCARFNIYMARMRKYFDFLCSLHANMRSLTFHLDVAHPRDNWLSLILSFLETTLCDNLRVLDIDWTVTPVRPCQVDMFCCVFNKVRSAFRHHRQRVGCFHQLMAVLTRRAPSVRTLHMPFDWSERSVLHLCRLRQLEVLKLTKYVNLNRLSQDLLDTVLANLPCLRHLELEVCMPTFSSQTLYSVAHNTLETLDVSRSRGFFLKRVGLPRLRTLCVQRTEWQGPLAPGRCDFLPCLYSLCSVGAPNLSFINRCRLQPYWHNFLYDELDLLLKKVCPCKEHATVQPVIQPAVEPPGDD